MKVYMIYKGAEHVLLDGALDDFVTFCHVVMAESPDEAWELLTAVNSYYKANYKRAEFSIVEQRHPVVTMYTTYKQKMFMTAYHAPGQAVQDDPDTTARRQNGATGQLKKDAGGQE